MEALDSWNQISPRSYRGAKPQRNQPQIFADERQIDEHENWEIRGSGGRKGREAMKICTEKERNWRFVYGEEKPQTAFEPDTRFQHPTVQKY